MPSVPRYDVAAGVQLLNRALERSGLTLRRFARDELVRDEKTVRLYRKGAPMPTVVREKLTKLARRRPRQSIPVTDATSFEQGAVRGLVALGFPRQQAHHAVSAALDAGARATSVADLIRRALGLLA